MEMNIQENMQSISHHVSIYKNICKERECPPDKTPRKYLASIKNEILEYIKCNEKDGLFETRFSKANPFYNFLTCPQDKKDLITFLKNNSIANISLEGDTIVVRHKSLDRKDDRGRRSFFLMHGILEQIYCASYDGKNSIKLIRGNPNHFYIRPDSDREYYMNWLRSEGFKVEYIDSAQTPRYHHMIISW